MYKKQILGLLCVVTLLFSGCKEQETQENMQSGEIWEQAPELNSGLLEYSKLQVQPWNSGRLAFTSGGNMAETENGYYYLCAETSTLYYADKTDLSLWVPVCAKPNCSHNGYTSLCDAFMICNNFIFKDGRIYFESDLSFYPELYPTDGNGTGIFSKSYNGSDARLEYVIEDSIVMAGGSGSSLLTTSFWICNVAALQTDGTCKVTSYLVTDEGQQIVYQKEQEEGPPLSLYMADVWGDQVFYNALSGKGVYTIKDGKLVEVPNFLKYEEVACYRAGNIIRVIKEDGSFYDVNLETEEEVYVGEKNLDNSKVHVVLPNCITETTLSMSRPEGEENSFFLFDGENWQKVELPPELLDAPADIFFGMLGVSSDSLFFRVSFGQRNVFSLYRIPLDAETLVVEYCGQID